MSQYHFTPEHYLELMRSEVPAFDELQDRVADAVEGLEVGRILELGTGSGETARRVLPRYPAGRLTGIDVSEQMLARAREVLPAGQVEELLVQRLQDPLPRGPFDLVFSALTVHHLDGSEKAKLFRDLAEVLVPGGRFVLADVVVPDHPADAVTPLSPDYDLPSSVTEQLAWLHAAGFEAQELWSLEDLAVIRADWR